MVGYGLAFKAHHNSALNTTKFASTVLDRVRHSAISFNHGMEKADATKDDLNPSDCTIHDNYIKGYGAGILVHTHFHIEDRARVVVEYADVHDNVVIGTNDIYSDVASTPSQVGIYAASLKRFNAHNNLVLGQHEDMAIDSEYCTDSLLTANQCFNGRIAQLWDCDSYVAEGNLVVIDDLDHFNNNYGGKQVFLKSGGNSTGRVAFINNTFESRIAGYGEADFSQGCKHVEIRGNKFKNCSIQSQDQPFVLTEIQDNTFLIHFQVGAPVIDWQCVGKSYFLRNQVLSIDDTALETYTDLTQVTAQPSVKITMNRFGTTSDDARYTELRGNKIYGWPESIAVVEAGTGNQEWTVALIENEYNGTFAPTITDQVDNKIYLYDNFFINDVDDGLPYGRNTAHPSTAAIAAALDGGTIRYREGSTIKVYSGLVTTPGSTSRYVCTGFGLLADWVTVSDW